MRLFSLLACLAPPFVLIAQADGADPAAIAHIRTEYLALQDTSTGIELVRLDDGTAVARLDGKIRRIVRTTGNSTSKSYYYTSLGNPLFLFVVSPTGEQRIYFDPQLDDGPGRLRMIRWLEGKNHRSPTESEFFSTENSTLTEAFNLLHRAQGELKFSAEVYEAITRRLTGTDRMLARRELIATDTISQGEDEEMAQFASSEPKNPCWDVLTTFRLKPEGQKLRTVAAQGCDVGCMAYSTYEIHTDYDEGGGKIREASIINDYLLEDPDGRGIVNQGHTAVTATYYANDRPVYELLTSTHQGFEVFRRLKILEE